MKKIILFIMCSIICFTACGEKEKTIEKLIYGDKVSSILDKDEFNKVSISKSFATIKAFVDYINQCATNKVNLMGKKFKVRGLFYFQKEDFDYEAIDDKHYNYLSATIEGYSNLWFYIKFIDSDLNLSSAPYSAEKEFTFIVSVNRYNYNGGKNNIEGYSYDL